MLLITEAESTFAPVDLAPIRRSEWWRRYGAPLIIVLLLIIPLTAGFDEWGMPMDEGSLLVYPELIQKGALPYRDFETFYGPANPYLLAGAYSIFGTNISVERSVGFVYRLIILIAVFGLTRRWGTTLGSGCMALTGFVLVSSGVIAYAWYGAIAAALCSLWLIADAESSRVRCVFSGLLAGCAVLFRADLAPAVIAAALPLFLLMRQHKAGLIAGVALGLTPYALLVIAAGPQQVLNNLFIFPVIYSSPARHLPIFSAHHHILYLFLAHLLASAINVAAGAMAVFTKPRDIRARLLLGLSLFGLLLTHQAAQRADLLHVLFVAFTSIGLLPISLAAISQRSRMLVPPRSVALAAVFAAFVGLQTFVPERTAYFQQAFRSALSDQPSKILSVEQNGRSFPIGDLTSMRSVGRILSALERMSAPGERLFVGPADLRRTNNVDTFIYHLVPQLRPATYFLEMNPASANRPGSRLAADVKSADWLVLNRAWDEWNEPNASSAFASDEPNKILRDQFVLTAEAGQYGLFRRRAPSG